MSTDESTSKIYISPLAIGTSLGLPIFCYAMIMRFFINGYRTTPTAWSFAFLTASLATFISTVLLLSGWLYSINHRNKIRGSVYIVAFAATLGRLVGWHLGVPGAWDIYDSFYEGWIEPEQTIDGAIFGALSGYLLGKATIALSIGLLKNKLNQRLSYLLCFLATASTLITCASLLFSIEEYLFLGVGILSPWVLPFIPKIMAKK